MIIFIMLYTCKLSMIAVLSEVFFHYVDSLFVYVMSINIRWFPFLFCSDVNMFPPADIF